MTWNKLDNRAPWHPKVAALSDRAFRWWITGICYASEYLTDGNLPRAFCEQVPKRVRDELVNGRLWDVDDGNVVIHQYLDHQSSREEVVAKRAANAARVTRYRGGKRNGVTDSECNGATATERNAVGNALPARPDDRYQITEHRDQMQEQVAAPASAINSSSYEARRQQHCSFIGRRFEVPNILHVELRNRLGGDNPDAILAAWYADVDNEAVASGEPIEPDIFKWLKAKFATWRVAHRGMSRADAAARPPVTDEQRAHLTEVRAQMETQNAELDEELAEEYWRQHPWAVKP